MKISARINSFMREEGATIESIFKKLSEIEGVTHVDLNYPEHFAGVTVEQMESLLEENHLSLHGLAMRFRSAYVNGEYGNADPKISKKALALTMEAIDVCSKLNGRNVTVWLGFDGFDYSFQVDYPKSLESIIRNFQMACDYAKGLDMKLSIEYKPFEERAYSMIDSFGMSMFVLDKVQRDNLGLTLDYCHMLMKRENPAYGLSIALQENKLFAVHLNDGRGYKDDGYMLGAVSPIAALEFIYYLKKYHYDGMIYFDTFPIRERAAEELKANIQMFNKLCQKIDEIGLDIISSVIEKNDAIAVMDMLTNQVL